MSRLNAFLFAAIPASSALIYLYLNAPTRYAQYVLQPSETHGLSFPQLVVNPRRFQTQGDTVSLLLPASRLNGLSDEQILARFTRGFFGGWAFFVEAHFFKFTDWRFSRLDVPTEKELEVWTPSQISRTKLPALRTLFWGNFVVLDSSSVAQSSLEAIFPCAAKFANTRSLQDGEGKRWVEVGFGRKNGGFSGSQRFEVWREHGGDGEENREMVVIKLSNMRGNPTQDGNMTKNWLNLFHQLYARCLFDNGVSEILKS